MTCRPLLLLATAVALLSGCAPSPTASNNGTFLNEKAEYMKNVSSLYSAGPGKSTVDMRWKDSLGTIHSMEELIGKRAVLTFWTTNVDTSVAQVRTLDSLLGQDSIAIVSVATDLTIHSFKTVYDFVMAKHIRAQVIVDSSKAAFREYAQYSSDNSVGVPETFIIDRQGNVRQVLQGYFTSNELLTLLRQY